MWEFGGYLGMSASFEVTLASGRPHLVAPLDFRRYFSVKILSSSSETGQRVKKCEMILHGVR